VNNYQVIKIRLRRLTVSTAQIELKVRAIEDGVILEDLRGIRARFGSLILS